MLSYREFLEQSHTHDPHDLEKKAGEIISRFQPQDDLALRFAPVTFLLDYSTQTHLYLQHTISKLLGFDRSWLLQVGLQGFHRRWHPADFEIINKQVFSSNIDFLKTIPHDAYSDYIFSYNYRFLNPAEKYIIILQRFSYIPSPHGILPAGIIGVATDISHYKSDTSIIQTIEKVIDTDMGQLNELILKKTYPVTDLESTGKFSLREIEILQLLAQGKSSKQIAAALHISINMVNNHRKNMLAKSGSNTSSELINFASHHGFIQDQY